MTSVPTPCVSDLTLDRVVAGGEPPAHLATCPRCSERLELFRQLQQATAPDIARLLRNAKARRSAAPPSEAVTRRWWLALIPVAAAALLAFVATRDKVVAPDERDGVRLKGSSLKFFRQRAGEVVPGTSGDQFLPGDRLRFVVSSGATCQFLLVGIEPSGEVTAYHPYHGARSEPLAAGAEVALPGSLELDASSGTEYFVGIFSRAPIGLEQVRREVARVRATAQPLPSAGLALPATLHWVVVNKP